MNTTKLDKEAQEMLAVPLFESMTKVKIGIYAVRVWRKTKTFSFGDGEVSDALLLLEAWQGVDKIREILDAMPRVTAYEITTASGQGAVVYREWP